NNRFLGARESYLDRTTYLSCCFLDLAHLFGSLAVFFVACGHDCTEGPDVIEATAHPVPSHVLIMPFGLGILLLVFLPSFPRFNRFLDVVPLLIGPLNLFVQRERLGLHPHIVPSMPGLSQHDIVTYLPFETHIGDQAAAGFSVHTRQVTGIGITV